MPNPNYDPLDALVQRIASGLRQAVVLEHAIQAGAQAVAEATGVAATMAAARKALALERATKPAEARPIELRHGLWCREGSLELLDAPVEAVPAAIQPRRTRGP